VAVQRKRRNFYFFRLTGKREKAKEEKEERQNCLFQIFTSSWILEIISSIISLLRFIVA